MNIILMGIQGSGKSTQGNLLTKELKLPYLSSGHIFREMAKEKSKWGRYVKETLSAGYLIADQKTVPIIHEYLSKKEYQEGWILDGFPRTTIQAKKFKYPVHKVIYLKVSDKEALWRLSYRNGDVRDDETLRAVRKRIELYHKVTEPVLEYYRKMNLLAEINGELPIEEVHKKIMKYMETVQRRTNKNGRK